MDWRSLLGVFITICGIYTEGQSSELISAVKTEKKRAESLGSRSCLPPKSSGQKNSLFVKKQGFFIQAEFLYWQPLAGNSLEFAFVKDFPVYDNGTYISDGLAGTVYRAEFEWEPGFRIGALYQFAHDSFELFVDYLYYNSSGSKTARIPSVPNPTQLGQAAIKSTFPTNLTSYPVTPVRVDSSIHLNYQETQLKLEKHLSLSRWVCLGLSAEIEASWLKQRWSVETLNIAGQTAKTRSNWGFWGVGPGIGIDCNWYFLPSFSLFSGLDFSFLYGQHTNTLHTLCSSGTINPLYQLINPSNFRIAPHAKCALGLSWDQPWDSYMFHLSASYEFNTFANLQEVYGFHDIGLADSEVYADALYSIRSNLLFFQGLTANFGFHF